MENKNIKVLFIIDMYKPHIGGVEILFSNIAYALANSGNEVVILTSKYDKKLKNYEEEGKNIKIYRVGHNRYDFMFFSIFKGIKLAKNLDIIHTTTYNSAISGSIISYFSNKKVILTVHEIFGELWYKFLGYKGFFFKLFEKLIFKFNYDKYICVSNYTKNSLRISFGIPDEKLITIYNGIDYKFWEKNNYTLDSCLQIKRDLNIEKNFVGLFYGRPGISKGLNYYLLSIKGIINIIPNFKALLIIPDSKNNPINNVKKMVKNLGIDDYVLIIPGISNKNLPLYILMSDFVIIPSLAEGFGFAIAEVSALEKPIITTNIASIPEVASGKICFVEPSNPSSIIDGVNKLLDGKYSNIPKKIFTLDDNYFKTLDLYKKMIGE